MSKYMVMNIYQRTHYGETGQWMVIFFLEVFSTVWLLGFITVENDRN